MKINQEENTQNTQKEFDPLKKVYLSVEKISQLKDDKAKHTWSQRTTKKLKKFEKTNKKSLKHKKAKPNFGKKVMTKLGKEDKQEKGTQKDSKILTKLLTMKLSLEIVKAQG